MFASRLDMAKNAAMAPISQMSASVNPCPRSGSVDCVRFLGNLEGKIEHGALPGRQIGLAVVDRHLIGDQGILGADAQDGPVRDHAVLALVGVRGRHHDHFPLRLAQTARFLHERVVISEKGPKLVGPVGQPQKNVGHETGLLLHRQNALAHVFGQIVQRGDRIATDGGHAVVL